MSRAVRGVALVVVAGVSVSCLPMRFNDLEDSAWVQLAERNDSQASGDWAIDVIALPPASGKQGMIFEVSLGSPPPGLAEVVFDEHGSVTSQIGSNFLGGGGGIAGPLDDKSNVDALAPYGTTAFIAGAGDKPQVVKLNVGITGGTAILPATSGISKAGRSVATGNMGLGSAAPDVAVMGQLSLSIIPGGDPSKIKTCGTKLPNGPSATLYTGWETVALAAVKKNGHDQIVMAGSLLDDSPFIYVLEASAIQDGQPCPSTGFKVSSPPPNAIALATLDSDTELDLVTGTGAASGSAGTVTFYRGPLTAANPPATLVPATEDSPSFTFGNRIKIADLDGDGKAEIIVSDSGASLSNVNESGQVFVYNYGMCPSGSATAKQRGPFCLVNTLFDSTPDNKDQFGRALAVSPFPTPTSKTNVLAVAEKNKLWVFFKISAAAPDPRVK